VCVRAHGTSIIHKCHQREAQSRDTQIKVRLKAFELMSCNGCCRSVVVAIESLRIDCKLEQDATTNVLEPTSHSTCWQPPQCRSVDSSPINRSEIHTNTHRFDGFLLVIQVEFRDDDLAIRHGREQKVLRQANQGGVVLGRLFGLLHPIR
jgi:hypothetical protein